METLPNRTVHDLHSNYVIHLERLLKLAHDKMDDDNVSVALSAYCRWCNEADYDAQGLKHKDDCILVQIRRAINI